jgi:hypothetical protein
MTKKVKTQHQQLKKEGHYSSDREVIYLTLEWRIPSKSRCGICGSIDYV